MHENPAASDWATSRGRKWRAQLTGMEPTLAPVDEPLILALRLDAPCRIADIGCGGGGTTLEIARRAPSGSVVHGFDISQDLIDLARTRTTAGDLNIAFHLADMATAPPPEALYDRIVSRFGIMFFDDPQAAFTNIARWLAPSGRFALAAWGSPSDNPWISLAREVVAQVAEIPPAQPDAPSPFRYADPAPLLNILANAGFAGLHVTDWRGMLPLGGGLPAAEAATFALDSFSSFREILNEAGEPALHAAREALTALFLPHEHNGAVRLGACVHIFTGGLG